MQSVIIYHQKQARREAAFNFGNTKEPVFVYPLFKTLVCKEATQARCLGTVTAAQLGRL